MENLHAPSIDLHIRLGHANGMFMSQALRIDYVVVQGREYTSFPRALLILLQTTLPGWSSKSFRCRVGWYGTSMHPPFNERSRTSLSSCWCVQSPIPPPSLAMSDGFDAFLPSWGWRPGHVTPPGHLHIGRPCVRTGRPPGIPRTCRVRTEAMVLPDWGGGCLPNGHVGQSRCPAFRTRGKGGLGRITTDTRGGGRGRGKRSFPLEWRERPLRYLGNDVVCETDRQLGSWDGVGREDAERGTLLPGGIANVRPSCALGRRVWW